MISFFVHLQVFILRFVFRVMNRLSIGGQDLVAALGAREFISRINVPGTVFGADSVL